MKLEEFVSLVDQMRSAQRNYFRTRSHDVLSQSKELERRVDKAIADHKNKQKELF